MTVPKKAPPRRFDGAFSYWVDERMPDLSKTLRPFRVDADAFTDWLKPILGEYRGNEEIRKGTPSITEEIAAVKALRDDSRVLLDRLAPNALGPYAWHLMTDRAWKAKWPSVYVIKDSASESVAMIHALACAIIPKLESWQRPGRKQTTASRDRLAARIHAWFRDARLKSERANEATIAVLVACDVVRNAHGIADVGRAIKRGKKLLPKGINSSPRTKPP